MSAREDYPAVATLVDACNTNAALKEPEAVRMFREIDALRLWKAAVLGRLERAKNDGGDGDAVRVCLEIIAAAQ